MTTVIFYIGPFIGLAGFFLLFLIAIRRVRSTKEPKPLTQTTMTELQIVGELYDEPFAEVKGAPFIPIGDILSLYLNSRADRNFVNSERLDTDKPGCVFLLNLLERNHAKVKKLLWGAVKERCADRLRLECLPLQSRRLLWTYSEEQELISQLAEYCASDRREIMLSRLH